jgi:hypothetical protein
MSEVLVPVLQSCFVALGLICLLSFIPIVGGVVSQTPGVPVFLQGIFVFGHTNTLSLRGGDSWKASPRCSNPEFLALLGLCSDWLGITYASIFVISFIVEQLLRRFNAENGSGQSGVSFLIGALLGPVVGIVPLLMYSKYVVLYLKGHA